MGGSGMGRIERITAISRSFDAKDILSPLASDGCRLSCTVRSVAAANY
jgi:hypothetical protein